MPTLPVSIDYFESTNTWPKEFPAAKVEPDRHTMTVEDFYGYIGRRRGKILDADPFSNQSKKFSEEQKKYLEEAYKKQLQVRVFGAMREHADVIAEKLGYELLEETGNFHRRQKYFNCNRSFMIKTRNTGDNTYELWVFVFPSREYVDQFAELIKAIFDDFSLITKRKTQEVLVQHFPLLEKNLVEWTSFKQQVRTFVRYGDVVAIGHVEDFAKTLSKIGFQQNKDHWEEFGVNNIFGTKTFVSTLNNRRIVLIGFKESFWGSASGYFVSSIIEAGARHILYGSKAATMITQSRIGSIAAPTQFLNLKDGQLQNEKVPSPGHASSMLEPLQIEEITTSLTVPTVIGETQEQVEDYLHAGGTCMDCENGHIAHAVSAHNETLRARFQNCPIEVQFIPVHYITDFIHTASNHSPFRWKLLNLFQNHIFGKKERDSSNLTEAKSDKQKAERNQRKTDAFNQIGAFFGYYTHIYGLTESFIVPDQVFGSRYTFDILGVSTRYRRIRASLQAGYAHAVAAEMLEDFRQGGRSIEELLTLGLAAQKCGFLSLFTQIEDVLKRREFLSERDLNLLNWFDVLKLKYYTQLGNQIGARKKIDEMTQRIGASEIEARLVAFDQYEAFKRREMLISCAESSPELTKHEFLLRAQFGDDTKTYQQVTTKFFEVISLLLTHDSYDFQDDLLKISDTLRRIRLGYYALQEDMWMHAHREKGAIASIFLESCFYLKSGPKYHHLGLFKLYIAHLLNVRFGGNERSEAYGEILWAAGDLATRDLLAAAMRRDPFFQMKFQRFATAVDGGEMKHIFEECSKIFLTTKSADQVESLNELTQRYDAIK